LGRFLRHEIYLVATINPEERTRQMRDFLEKQGGLATAMIAGGLLCIPILGWMPLIAIISGIAASAYFDKSIHPK
jgi:hypothetical protein